MSDEKVETVEIILPDGQIAGEKPKRKYKPREKKDSSNVSKSNSKAKSPVGETEISSLLVGVFSLISLKAGEHWQLTFDEAKTISTPLSNILEKMNVIEEVAKVSDGAMLLIACGMVMIPRIMISAELSKVKKPKSTKLEEVKATNGQESRDTKEIHDTVINRDNEKQSNNFDNVKTILESNVANI